MYIYIYIYIYNSSPAPDLVFCKLSCPRDLPLRGSVFFTDTGMAMAGRKKCRQQQESDRAEARGDFLARAHRPKCGDVLRSRWEGARECT